MQPTFPWRLVAMLGALVALVLLVGLTVRSCDKHRSQAAQGRVDRGQTEALSNSAADAVDTLGNAAAREGASEDLTRSNEQEIRNAPGAKAPVDPAARAAGLRSLCRRAAYRDSEQCRMLKPRP
jgi:Flp pilus assembly protein TadB